MLEIVPHASYNKHTLSLLPPCATCLCWVVFPSLICKTDQREDNKFKLDMLETDSTNCVINLT